MNIFVRLVRYLRDYRVRLLTACLCSACVAGFTAAYAWLVRPVLDGIFIEKDQFLLVVLPVALLCIALLKGLFGYGQHYLMSYVGNQVVADIRQQLFLQLVRLPVRFHDANTSGRLVSRVIHDVNTMANAIPTVLKDLFQQGLTFLAMIAVAFYQNWKLATVLIVVIPLSFYAMSRIGKRLRRLATRGQEKMGDLTSVLQETLVGVRVVKAYGREESESERFGMSNKAFVRATMKAAQLSALNSPLMETIGVLGIAVIIWYGGFLVVNGTMTPGAFFSFLTAMFMAYAPVRRLAGANTSIQSAIAAAQRVFTVLDMENEEGSDDGRKTLQRISGALEFRGVSYQYEGSDRPALSNIDLTVSTGEIVALVGSSGSGKTTLVSLVPRFYHPSEGAILLDGHDLRHVSLRSLRRQIAIVTQETLLFDDTVRNNIAYGRVQASEEEVVAAAKAAYADAFIERLPNGFETLIGENGVKLSGGERQRLAIARAILRDPPILILDEATSSLDSQSERMVQRALSNLMKNRTTLVIAHRLSTVQHAHRIVVLNRGQIVETGTHQELLRRGESYAKLYEIQFQKAGVPS